MTVVSTNTTVSAPVSQQIGSAGSGIPVAIGGDTTVTGDLAVTGTLTVGGMPVGGAWGDITGDIQDQTDLQDEFATKADVTNAVFISDVPDGITSGFTITPLTGTGAIEVALKGDTITEFKIEGSDGFPAYCGVYAYGDGPATVYPSHAGFRARGTDAVPGAVLSGDTISSHAGYGYNGAGFAYGGSVSRVASENWTNTAQGSQINLGVIRQGTILEAIALQILNDNTRSRFMFAPGSRLQYDGSSSANRLAVQANSGADTTLLFRAPGTSASDASGIRMNSSDNTADMQFMLVKAVNANTGAGAFRIQTGKAIPTTITALNALDGGSGYDSDGSYAGTPLTGGTGTGATADITIAGGIVTVVTLVAKGTGYTNADILSADDSDIGGRTGGAAFTVNVNGVATSTVDSPDPVAFSGSVSGTVYATVNAGTAAVAATDVVRKSDLDALVLPPSTVTGLTAGTIVGQARAVTDAALGIAWCIWDGANWINTVTHSAVA